MCLAGLLLPILGALPDALIIVVSGLGGTKEEAAEQVLLTTQCHHFAGDASLCCSVRPLRMHTVESGWLTSRGPVATQGTSTLQYVHGLSACGTRT